MWSLTLQRQCDGVGLRVANSVASLAGVRPGVLGRSSLDYQGFSVFILGHTSR